MFLYRKAPDGVCGCGDLIENHNINSGHHPVDYKKYSIENYAKGKR